MTISSVFYALFITPLELLFEITYSITNDIVHHPGWSIIVLSLAVNFLCLPLYNRADAMQAEERDRETKLRPWINHIKKYFKGTERFMMLQEFYRQNDYKPTDALKGSVSLLLQIPFFIAAYHFLSHLPILEGVPFGPITNLGAPDGLLKIGNISVNILPILMTVINIIASLIYLKGMSLKSKIQLYGMALIFLVLLYTSPAGLVFYWTLNNLFSLAKNIFYKLKNPHRVFAIIMAIAGIGLLATCGTFAHTIERRSLLGLILLSLLFFIPLGRTYVKTDSKILRKISHFFDSNNKTSFTYGSVVLAIITGLLIPSAIIHASPLEFLDINALANPILYIWHTLAIAVGTFVIWGGVFHGLAGKKTQSIMNVGMWILTGVAIFNYMFVGTTYGNLSSRLIYDIAPTISYMDQASNLFILGLSCIALLAIWVFSQKFIKGIYLVIGIGLISMSLLNIHAIHSIYSNASEDLMAQLESRKDNQPQLRLSKEGKNVVVFMMDRAVNFFLPYIFEEKPELKRQFAGFTFYPNTVSFGPCTNIGIPAVFGGYEYTPEEMNKRSTELLMDKHHEALKVMPVLFERAGFDVTVSDPTYAGYDYIPDLSIYKDYPNIRTQITEGRMDETPEEASVITRETLKRNFFTYSLFRIVPSIIKTTFYNQGRYHNPSKSLEQIMEGLSRSQGYRSSFMGNYVVLKKLPTMTTIVNEELNTFYMMCNDTTHEPMLLQMPDYTPAWSVDNSTMEAKLGYKRSYQGKQIKLKDQLAMMHYHINMAAAIKIGQWLDFLRENDLYDNTRIVIVADHGRGLSVFDEMKWGKETHENAEWFNPLLLYKDFNTTEFKISDTLMTNADTPWLATRGLIENARNPFTGKLLHTDDQKKGELHIFFSSDWQTNINNGTTFLPGKWLTVKDNIFDMSNWKHIEDPFKKP